MSVINREHYRQELLRCEAPDAGSYNRGIQCALNVLDKEPALSSAWTWISVEDRLPDRSEVLVACHRIRHGLPSPPFCALAKYDDSGFHSNNINMDLCEVTHWAPLPPLPGEVEMEE